MKRSVTRDVRFNGKGSLSNRCCDEAHEKRKAVPAPKTLQLAIVAPNDFVCRSQETQKGTRASSHTEASNAKQENVDFVLCTLYSFQGTVDDPDVHYWSLKVEGG